MFAVAIPQTREVDHHPVPDVPMAAAPILDGRRPLVEYCPRCDHPEDEHQMLVQGASGVLRCLVCNRICRRL